MRQLDVVRASPVSTRQILAGRAPGVLGAVGAVVGFAGSWIPSYWGDEAASVMSAWRSWPSLAGMLGNVDGVHGLYYALLHVWMDVFGASEAATRALSSIAVGFMVAGTVVLARAFVTPQLSIWAGIVCIVVPRTTFMAAETRSYALGAAAAVWVTVLLVTVLRRDGSAGTALGRGWLAYAAAMAACMYLFLYLGMLLLVHAAFVAVLHGRMLSRWARAGGLALVVAAPIVAVGYLQRKQIRFLGSRHYATAAHVLVKQWFGYPLLAALGWLLVLFAIGWMVYALSRRAPDPTGRFSLSVLAGLWLVIPTAVLLIADATIAPVYNVRYLSLSTPAVAIFVALGIAAAAELVARRGRATGAALVCAVVILSVPVYIGQRLPWCSTSTPSPRGIRDWRSTSIPERSTGCAMSP